MRDKAFFQSGAARCETRRVAALKGATRLVRLLTLSSCLAVVVTAFAARAARAAITIENSTASAITCRVGATAAAGQEVSIAAGATKALDTASAIECQYQNGGRSTSYSLQPGRKYRFVTSAGQLELRAVPLKGASPGEAPRSANKPTRPDSTQSSSPRRPNGEPAIASKPRSWPQVRTVKVIVAGGKEYRAFHRNWQERGAGIVSEASARFEQQFPIRFQVVGYQPWLYDLAPRTANDAFEWLHKIDRGDADMVIGFTMVPFPGPRGEIRGVTQYYSPYVVIPDAWGTTGATTRLVHELCHVFGAFHVAMPGSVMQLGFERTPKTFQFGAPTEETVMLGKDFNFDQGVDSLSEDVQEKIRNIYRAHHHPIEKVEDDPIVVGYRYQVRRADMSDNTERQKQMQAVADRLSPPAAAPGPGAGPGEEGVQVQFLQPSATRDGR